MGFQNPIVGGMSNLIRAAIQSPNYSPGIAGWIVRKDGSAEFNNLTIRGTFFGQFFILNNTGLFVYNQASFGPSVVAFTSGTGHWTAPAGVTTLLAECWGGNAGAGNGAGGGGGGGEYAQEPALAVTPGNSYAYSVGSGGAGGIQGGTHNGVSGGNSTMAGDVATVTAHGGSGGGGGGASTNGTAGAGGTGSTNTTHFDGGSGAAGFNAGSSGGGGGSSAGNASAGNNGHSGDINGNGGAGGTAVAGGGSGAKGGDAGKAGSSSTNPPGGGGGGGGIAVPLVPKAGGAGSNGQVQLTYTPASTLALVTSDCGIQTTDPLLGVQCPVGFTSYNAVQSIQANLNAASLSFIDSINAVQAPGLIGLTTVSVTNDALQLSSPANAANDVQAFLALIKAAAGNTALVEIMNAALNIKTSTTPGTPGNGTTVYVDGQGHLAMIDQAGLQHQVPGTVLATYPATTVTAATLTILGQGAIPGGDAEAGSVYELEIEGTWTQATGTPVTMQFGARFGATNLANQIIGTTGFNAGGTGRFTGRVRVYCISNGALGLWQTTIRVTVTPNANPNNSVTICDDDAGVSVSKDSTVQQFLVMNFAWGSTTGSPSIINRRQVFKRIA